MIKNNYNPFLHFSVLLVFLFIVTPASAAYQTLEILNIKAAGSGSPALSANNRIFRAYPGIEYNIRAAVIGGDYPYTYALSNAPSGMTINSRTGEITWSNPQSSATNITLTVTDASSSQVQATWSITVGTTGFKFVDGSGSNGTGTISSPYNSIANMAAAASSTDIIYFRTGTYSIGSGGWVSYPVQWVAYPGETVTINMNDREMATPGDALVYFDGFIFDNMDYNNVGYSGLVIGCSNYNTIRRNVFQNFSNINVPENNNYGMLKAMCVDTQYYNNVIQDNEFKSFQGGNAIGSLYHQTKMLIENNYIHTALGQGGAASHNGISPKVDMYNFTVRGNKIIMANGWLFGYDNSAMENNIEFAFNLFVNTSAGRMGGLMNWNMGQDTTWFYRNTLVGDLILRGCTSRWDVDITNNVISNPNTSFGDWTLSGYIGNSDGTGCYNTVQNNLTSTSASSLVDANNEYKLVSGQSQYVGSRGWQLSDGYTPMELVGTTEGSLPVISGCTLSGASI